MYFQGQNNTCFVMLSRDFTYIQKESSCPHHPQKINTCTDKYMYIIDSSTSCKLMKTDTQHTSEEFTPEQPCTCVHIKKY